MLRDECGRIKKDIAETDVVDEKETLREKLIDQKYADLDIPDNR